jgi:hypothetical protein
LLRGTDTTDVLFFIAVNCQCRPPVLAQILGQVVGDSLRSGEDQNLAILLADLVQMFNELASLLKIGTDFNYLSDIVIGCQIH